ncbi:hypothetical protein BBJ28_00009582 [Nothophytophthora sp. Chile5]|nr:hypothetical protein BBJ28_00009582 [Nothophytophthora sp. Chile5]
MVGIIGTDVSRDRLANFLDGAGGDVQVALEHYFMSVSTLDSVATPAQGATTHCAPPSTSHIQLPEPATSLEEAQARAHAEAQANHERRPLSQLILGIPPISEPRLTPIPGSASSSEAFSAGATKGKHEVNATPPRPAPVDVTSTFVGEPSPGMPPPVPSPCPSPVPPSAATAA